MNEELKDQPKATRSATGLNEPSQVDRRDLIAARDEIVGQKEQALQRAIERATYNEILNKYAFKSEEGGGS